MICNICPNSCYLSENQIGFCKVYKNKDSRIINLFENQISQIAVDNIEKKPLYHYKSFSKTLSVGFIGCSMSCDFCANWKISQNTDLVDTKEFSINLLIEKAIENNCKSISFTYNEPLLYIDFIKRLYKEKPKDLDIVIKTNAFIQEVKWKDILNYVDAVNIDYKGSIEDYVNICKIKNISYIYNNIIYAINNIHTEISIPVYQHSQLEDYDFLINLSNKHTPLHLLKVYSTPNFINNTNKDALINIKNHLKCFHYVYVHNVYDKSLDNNTYCNNCKSVLIDRVNKKVNSCICKTLK
jgi:pyruvate formate lyase activating enzyme